ncbi:MAG: PQQ-binding-like beta-propeller repeat protein [Kiloniellales bacterium]|nr:PQQ-binding-like beta-propeller repeat protein [Kiloniellales bacterium]
MTAPPRRIAALLSVLALAGCDTWFGAPEGPPLPGERISVLALDQRIEPDPGLDQLEIRLPRPYVNGAWSQAGGVPSHAMQHLALGESLEVVWRSSIGTGNDYDHYLLAQPLVVRNTVFTMDAQELVRAFSVEDGDLLWEADLEDDIEDEGYFGGGLAFDNGVLYVTTGFGMVYALDADTGERRWAQDLPGPMRAAPTVAGGRVFATTVDNQLFALDVRDGRRIWQHSGLEETTRLLGSASPAVAGSSVVVPYSSGEIYALLAENGRVLWDDNLSAVNRIDPVADLGQIRGLPVIDRGVVLAISHSGRMVAIELRRGARAWEAELGGVQMPWVAGNFIYLVTNETQVVCILRRNGGIRWVQALPRFEDEEDKEGPIQWFGPVLAGNRLVLAGSNREVVWLSPYTGEILERGSLPSSPVVTPVVAQRTLYFLTEGAQLIAMRETAED